MTHKFPDGPWSWWSRHGFSLRLESPSQCWLDRSGMLALVNQYRASHHAWCQSWSTLDGWQRGHAGVPQTVCGGKRYQIVPLLAWWAAWPMLRQSSGLMKVLTAVCGGMHYQNCSPRCLAAAWTMSCVLQSFRQVREVTVSINYSRVQSVSRDWSVCVWNTLHFGTFLIGHMNTYRNLI